MEEPNSEERWQMKKRNEIWATFTSSFPTADSENPHPKGYLVASAVRDGLMKLEVSVVELENWRDAGWSIDCVIDGKRVYCYVTHVGKPSCDWVLCCTYDRGLLSWLRSDDRAKQVEVLAARIDEVLRENPPFDDVRWYEAWRGETTDEWQEHP